MASRKKPAAKEAAPEPLANDVFATIGHNQPPEPDPFETLKVHIDDLYEQAEQWLDGEPIANERQAEAVTALRGMIDEAFKLAEATRAEEKKPHWDAGVAVDAKWKPLKDRAEKAKKAASAKLTAWLQLVQAEIRRKAQEAAAFAAAKEEALRQAHIQQQTSGSLIDADRSEDLERENKEAKKAAKVAEKQTSTVRTDYGSARLRTVWHVQVVDRKELLKHYILTDADWLGQLLFDKAQSEVRGVMKRRFLPGCKITSTEEV